MAGQLIEARVFNVQPLIGGDDALLLLEGRHLALGFLERLPRVFALRGEEGRELLGWVNPQFQRGGDVGVGKGIGQGGGKARVGRLVGDLDHIALARGLDVQLFLQQVHQPLLDGALAVGVGLPLFADVGVVQQFEVADHAQGHTVAGQDVDLRSHEARHRHRGVQHRRHRVGFDIDHHAGGAGVLLGQQQADRHGGGHNQDKHQQRHPFAGAQY